MAIPSEWAELLVSPTQPYLRVSKVCLMLQGRSYVVTIVESTAFRREIVDCDTRDRFSLDRVRMVHD